MSKTNSTFFLVLSIYLVLVSVIKSDRMLVYASPSTLKVPDDFLTIQEAINNASPGDIIFVHSGTYQENIIIKKSITLIGEDRENTIINGSGSGSVIIIMASQVTISRFTITNSHAQGFGIYIGYFGNIINDNIIISNNIGIKVEYSSGNQICRNIISSNNIGIQMFSASGNKIYRNTFANNYFGIDIYYNSLDNTIYENTFQQNSYGVRISYNSNNNVFYYNNFIVNTKDVYAEQTTNVWSYDGKGNYWDKYEGDDLNKDGIGDIPHNITYMDKDYYPLMGKLYSFAISFKGEAHYVIVISNSTITNFAFKNFVEIKSTLIIFNASDAGFVRITIPKDLLKKIHMVLVNEKEVNVIFLDEADPENFHLYIELCSDCSVEIVYSEFIDLYDQLLFYYSNLLNKLDDANKSFNIVKAYFDELKEQLNDISSAYQSLKRNFGSLLYIIVVASSIFIVATFYLSKAAHEKSKI
ncbi:MAG: NosD domain-containing protein [Candidatus Bathyarchaeia archaeon]